MTAINPSTIKKYLVSVTHNGNTIASFSLETVKDPVAATDRFLNFFLVRRSAWFDLKPEDIEEIKKTRQQLEVEDNNDAEFLFQVMIKDTPVFISFFPHKFAM